MAFFRGEREPNRGIDPVIAFMHDANNPRDGIVNPLGEVVPLSVHQKPYGPPQPLIFEDTSTGMERIPTLPEQTEVAIIEFLEPTKSTETPNQINHNRKPLSLRIASLLPTVFG